MKIILKLDTSSSHCSDFDVSKVCIAWRADELTFALDNQRELNSIFSHHDDEENKANPHHENDKEAECRKEESKTQSLTSYIASSCDYKYFYLILYLNKDHDEDESSSVEVFQIFPQYYTEEKKDDHLGYKLLVLKDEKHLNNNKILILNIDNPDYRSLSDDLSNTSILGTYCLKTIPIRNSKTDIVMSKNTYYKFEMKTFFENDFFLESLNAISSIVQLKCDDENYTEKNKKMMVKSGLIIKVQRVKDDAYIIIDSSVESDNDLDRVRNGKESKKRRGDNLNGVGVDAVRSNIDDTGYFVTPAESLLLTDFMFIVIAQVKRGELTVEDLSNARRKNSILRPGYLGLRCRHCGGTKRGHYFPTTSKNLQATPSMIYKHLLTCNECPQSVKQVLKIAKAKHKSQVVQNGTTQIGFFNTLWERIRDPLYSGGSEKSRREVSEILQDFSSLSSTAVEPTDLITEGLSSSGDDQIVDVNSNNLSTKPTKITESLPVHAPSQLITSRTQNEKLASRSMESDRMISSSSSFETSALYDQVNPIFDSRSLNLTIDILDGVAFEILNSLNNHNPLTLGHREIQSNNQSDLEQWDPFCLGTLREMVEKDQDYNDMIDMLVNMD